MPSLETALPVSNDASFRVLGVRVHPLQIPDVVERIERWIQERDACRYIAFTGMHGVAESLKDERLKRALNDAGLVVPDGMPLVWLGRQHGYPLKRRVYGPELMETLCRVTGSRYRHFFYGGAPGVPERLAAVLQERYGIRVAGSFSPPFRPMTPEDERELEALIAAADPDLLWVGLSTPKQEQWMFEHRERLRVPVLLGVGAAFDFHTGRVQQAPVWMREHGLEWLFRLVSEPRRLWRRYLIHGSKFAWNVALELSKIRKFN